MAWTEEHVRRLFWRAGFGATPEEARRWAAAGKRAAIAHLLTGGSDTLRGPAPRLDAPLDPVNEWGHDTIWFLDRMVRSGRPLEEKLTLFWTDHFGVADGDTPHLLGLNRTYRKHGLGSFPRLLEQVTRAPGMVLFLSLANSDPRSPNENFARELMELYTLGAGYTERDIRQAAKAMTGWRSRWTEAGGARVFYDRGAHARGPTTIFGRRGRHDWRDVLGLAVRHPRHAPFLVDKLWRFFVTRPLDRATRTRLVRAYTGSGRRIAPVVARILAHPALYADLDAPDMVKCPAVLVAGSLRTQSRGIETGAWAWLLPNMGQSPLRPPSVAGWDWGAAWLSTTTMKARFEAVAYLTREGTPLHVPDQSIPPAQSPAAHLEQALEATGRPWASAATRAALERIPADLLASPKAWEREAGAVHAQRAMRHLLLSGPDAHLH